MRALKSCNAAPWIEAEAACTGRNQPVRDVGRGATRSRRTRPRYQAIPIVGLGCGLRPEEIFALHRTDVDRAARVVQVRRRFTGGELKQGGKTDGSVRKVLRSEIVLDALDATPPEIDMPILFPAPRGGFIDAERFRYRE
jgi:integrase